VKDSLQALKLKSSYNIVLPEEIFEFYSALNNLLNDSLGIDEFSYWDKSYSAKEDYRKKIVFGLSGKEKQITLSDLLEFLNKALEKVELGIAKSYNPKSKTYSTYFINEIVDFEKISQDKNSVYIRPSKFKQKPLPLFLEGFVHALKVARTAKEKKDIYKTVRKSPLYDKVLKMYKVNAALDGQPEEIGRARVFTPGWLENESIWLHMEYKYLLELLRAGLCDEFYKDFFNALIPFQDPQRYGRSILENSSFIASSAFPDKKIHGNGFVARLSGSTSEFLHIWLIMNVGDKPFFINDMEELCLRFSPLLHKDLFTKSKYKLIFDNRQIVIDKNSYAFNFLGNTLVVYHNPKRLNTFGNKSAKIRKVILEDRKNNKFEVNSDLIPEDYSREVRSGNFSRIDIYLT